MALPSAGKKKGLINTSRGWQLTLCRLSDGEQ